MMVTNELSRLLHVLYLPPNKMAVLALGKGADRASLRIARWSMKLMGFNYDVKYKPGYVNVNTKKTSLLKSQAKYLL
uniref:Uncharacterized protein n=1 Tax=Trichuris muris TaxID=70415 RepID=A0A5S6QPE1_TRIMR